ncbi:MAG TPA: secretin N-terminal domain-containing protein, partial [Chlamydiales bacterium]|nr:secretin N-terminal domain-containing protein [Chlamydiales bacterium]
MKLRFLILVELFCLLCTTVAQSKIASGEAPGTLYSYSAFVDPPDANPNVANDEDVKDNEGDSEIRSKLVSTLELIALEDANNPDAIKKVDGKTHADKKNAGAKRDTLGGSESQMDFQDGAPTRESQGPVINFNNVNIVEFLRFVSRLTGENFIFDPDELNFSVTIISESPASLDDVMAALLQNLRIHDFELMEQGGNFLIHKNKAIKAPADLFREEAVDGKPPQLATQVFLIEYVDAVRVASIVRSMVTKDALVELLAESKRIVVTDTAATIRKLTELLTSIDSPKSGLEIGVYVGRNASPSALIALTEQLLAPVTKGQTFLLVANTTANSVFILSSPFLVEKALSMMQRIDVGDLNTGIFSFDEMKYDPNLARQIHEETQMKNEAEMKAGFTDDEIRKLSEQQIKQILKELGLSESEIRNLTKEDMRRQLHQRVDLGPIGTSIKTEIRKKKVFETALPLGQ